MQCGCVAQPGLGLSAAHHERRERKILLELKFDDREGSFEMQVSLADLKQKLLELCAVWLCCTTRVGFECCSSREKRARILLELKFDDREGSFEMQVSLADLKQKLLELCAVWLCCTTGFGFECFCFLGQRSPTLCMFGSSAGKRRAIRCLCKLHEDMHSKVV